DPILTGFEDDFTFSSKAFIAYLLRHRLGGQQRSKVKAAQPGNRSEPVSVQRIVLVAFNQAVTIAVLSHQPFSCQLDARPNTFKESMIIRALVLAERAKDSPSLGVDRRKIIELSTEMNCAVGLEGQPKVHVFASVAFQVGKQARQGMRVLPDV